MTENVDAGRPSVFPALTGLRFVAAMAVLMYHYGSGFADRSHAPHALVRILQNGNLGVSLFFVLSGFILTHTYQFKTVNRRFWGDFLVARWARIYPVYIVALGLGLIVAAPLTARTAAMVLLMLQTWTPPQSAQGYAWVTPAWTLSAELLFYLSFPLLLVGLRRLNGVAVSCVAVACAILLVDYGLPLVTPDSIGGPLIIPIYRLPEFIFGMSLCRLTVLYPKLSTRLGGHAGEVLITLALLVLMSVAADSHTRALVTCLIGLLIVQLSAGRGVVTAILSSRVMLLLGGASYSLYLLQETVRTICGRLMPHPYDALISPAVTITAGIAVFLVWEQPSRRMILATYKRLAPVEAAPVLL